jgi:hypothetical protein
MDEELREIFKLELRSQCQFVFIGVEQLNSALKKSNADAAWFALQAILVSAANISKLLWGNKKDVVIEARRPLREEMGVTEDSALNSRRLRNSFEHFDERLEELFGGEVPMEYSSRNIGPADSAPVPVGVESIHFGWYDPLTQVLTFWDRSADLQAIVTAVDDIWGLLKSNWLGAANDK